MLFKMVLSLACFEDTAPGKKWEQIIIYLTSQLKVRTKSFKVQFKIGYLVDCLLCVDTTLVDTLC